MNRLARYVFVQVYLPRLLWLVIAALALVSAIGWDTLVERLRVAPSPWWIIGPLATGAAVWTGRRLAQTGEQIGLDASGRAPASLGWPVAVLSVALLVVTGGFEASMPDSARDTGPAVVGIGGSLRVESATARFDWPAAVRWPIVVTGHDRTLPGSVVPEPRDRARFRRLLFVARAPWQATDHPLDPGWQRWCWAGWSCVAGWWVLADRRSWRGAIAAAVFLVVFLFL